jgi:hypothetical protein
MTTSAHLQFLAGEIHLEHIFPIIPQVLEQTRGNQRSPAKPTRVFSYRIRATRRSQLYINIALLMRAES